MKYRFIILLHFLLLTAISCFSQNTETFRDSVDVVHYSINLNITDFENETISGNTIISFRAEKGVLEKLTLDLKALKVDSVISKKGEKLDFEQKNDIVIVKLDKNVSEKPYEVTVYYGGIPVKDKAWGGFFFEENVAFNMGVGMADYPHSYGRVWYPCIDDFTEKAKYNFNITVPKNFKAICSGKFISKEKELNGNEIYRWELRHEVPAYVTNVAVGEYLVFKDEYKNALRSIPIEIYALKNLIKNVEGSFKNLKPTIALFEESFGPYVWDKVGYVGVPFGSGAMEHVCNISYPNYAINGTLDRETLMAHELSHHWFGNLVTCKTSQDMWLNEGWASFCEALFTEKIYGHEAYKDYVRNNHTQVLKLAHIYDNGYRAVYGVPPEYTYGSTVYDKGADVAHTLRYYIGDSVFFKSLTEYMNAYSYKAASTEDFKNFMSVHSDLKLDDFFKSWVYTEGFPHFSGNYEITDSLRGKYKHKTILSQELKERDLYSKNNRIEISFFDENLTRKDTTILLSGKTDTFLIDLNFKAKTLLIDPEEKISDATVDNYRIIKEEGIYTFPNTDFSAEVTKIQDSILISSKTNYINFDYKSDKYKMLNKKYSSIEGVTNDSTIFEGVFYYSTVNENIPFPVNNIVLFHRKNKNDEWKSIEYDLEEITKYEGYFTIKNMPFGDYTIGYLKENE